MYITRSSYDMHTWKSPFLAISNVDVIKSQYGWKLELSDELSESFLYQT
jgi:hypothetical protein